MDTPITQTEEPRRSGYSPGHSWFYKLGGKPLYPKQIRDDVIASGYRGYDEADIKAMAQRPEPKRSNSLRRHRKRIIQDLSEDLARYREVVRELHARRRAGVDVDDHPICSCPHVAVSLKHNHVYNGFARLHYVDELLRPQDGQLDLFDGL